LVPISGRRVDIPVCELWQVVTVLPRDASMAPCVTTTHDDDWRYYLATARYTSFEIARPKAPATVHPIATNERTHKRFLDWQLGPADTNCSGSGAAERRLNGHQGSGRVQEGETCSRACTWIRVRWTPIISLPLSANSATTRSIHVRLEIQARPPFRKRGLFLCRTPAAIGTLPLRVYNVQAGRPPCR